MLDIIQSNTVNCQITQLSIHLHPAFTKFCCRLHYDVHPAFTKFCCRLNYESYTSWSGVTQLWCWVSVHKLKCLYIHIVNCLITQLSTYPHPVFTKLCCRVFIISCILVTTATGVTQHWCKTAFMLDIVQSNILNCLITELSTHLHTPFTKFN
jgi:hypothetical protein